MHEEGGHDDRGVLLSKMRTENWPLGFTAWGH